MGKRFEKVKKDIAAWARLRYYNEPCCYYVAVVSGECWKAVRRVLSSLTIWNEFFERESGGNGSLLGLKERKRESDPKWVMSKPRANLLMKVSREVVTGNRGDKYKPVNKR